MSLSINQNIMAMNSYRNLSSTQNGLSKSLEKLSSGFRINRAADDAAGLAISEGLRSQVGGNKQAVRNAQDGISVVQTAEGALNEVHSILQRQRDLAVQAANDSNNDDARNNIKAEMTQLTKELDRISAATNFNGTQLLDGSAGDNKDGKLMFQVGANGDAASHILVDLASANVAKVAQAVSGAEHAEDAVKRVAQSEDFSAAANGDSISVTIGGKTFTENYATGLNETLTALKGQLEADSAINDKYTISLQGSNKQLKIEAKEAGSDATDIKFSEVVSGANSTVAAGTDTKGLDKGELKFDDKKGFNVSNHENAQRTISLIDSQINVISTARANLGAVQNRFEHTINNLNVAVENLSASESRIRDTDMASEMMGFTRNQILSQAGTAMLAQANQVPQGVLSLLR